MDSTVSIKISSTETYLRTLNCDIKSHKDILHWFQQLCDKLSSLLLEIAFNIKHSKYSINEESKDTILLYLLQLNTKLSVLIRIFTTENNAGLVINEARNYILQQIELCLNGLQSALNSNDLHPENSMGFHMYMDMALNQITLIHIEDGCAAAHKAYTAARQVIEEVLCHAMSIAQVALKDDCASIRGSSKEVLHNLDYLLKEIENKNISMCNVFIDYCCDKLCSLERKVNTAVMKLSLKVFSECTKPLDDLHKTCLKNCQNEDTLDELIADFDLHVDRMFQVGLFAVSCKAEKKSTLRMRNCLASLEALESELIPAMTSLNKDSSSIELLYYAEILKHYWMKQALDLKKYIYLIIDPFAFCQVTYEVIKEINEDLDEKLQSAFSIDKNLVKPITLQAKILYEMLLVSLTDSPPGNQEVIRKYLHDVICVTMEIDAAADKLLSDSNEMCRENVLRVFKRCKIQENILKKLLDALKQDDYCKINKDYSKDMTYEINAKNNQNTLEDHILEDITTRGKEILKERSVLYKTPKKNSKLNVINGINHSPSRNLNHLRQIQFSHSSKTDYPETSTNYDLQITDILNNLTQLSLSLQ